MFNMDDFVRLGGRYEFVDGKKDAKHHFSCVYRLFFEGEESLADVDVYPSGARMVKYRDDANFTLFKQVSARRNQAVEDNDMAFLSRSFLLFLRLISLLLTFVIVPLFTLIKMQNHFQISFLILLVASLMVGMFAYRIKPYIWSFNNLAHNDLAKIEG